MRIVQTNDKEENMEEEKRPDWFEEFRKIKRFLIKETDFNIAVIERLRLVIE